MLNDEVLKIRDKSERYKAENESYQKQLVQMFTQIEKLDSENEALSKAIERT